MNPLAELIGALFLTLIVAAFIAKAATKNVRKMDARDDFIVKTADENARSSNWT